MTDIAVQCAPSLVGPGLHGRRTLVSLPASLPAGRSRSVSSFGTNSRLSREPGGVDATLDDATLPHRYCEIGRELLLLPGSVARYAEI